MTALFSSILTTASQQKKKSYIKAFEFWGLYLGVPRSHTSRQALNHRNSVVNRLNYKVNYSSGLSKLSQSFLKFQTVNKKKRESFVYVVKNYM